MKLIHDKGTGRERYYIGMLCGERAYLVGPSWDCGWYWGVGYVQTKVSHRHFDGLFLPGEDAWNYLSVLDSTPLIEKEWWALRDLMRSIYTLKKAAELFHLGSSHLNIWSNETLAKGKKPFLAKRINERLLPELFDRVRALFAEAEKRTDAEQEKEGN
jgi:hypothetical protein